MLCSSLNAVVSDTPYIDAKTAKTVPILLHHTAQIRTPSGCTRSYNDISA